MNKEQVHTGQIKDTLSPVVAISLSGSKRSLSWTANKGEFNLEDILFILVRGKQYNLKHL